MTPWQWWATCATARADGEWKLGEFDTREAAVRAGDLEYATGEPFYIIEARSSTDAKYGTGNYEIVPFVKTRNEERLLASADRSPEGEDAEERLHRNDESAVRDSADAQPWSGK